jgi:hypothetical protein
MNKVLNDIKNLSSGTMATLTGFKSYHTLDVIRGEWHDWVERESKRGLKLDTWVSAFEKWMGYLGVEVKNGKADFEDLFQHFPVSDEWTCQKCLTVNDPNSEKCKKCGTMDPFSDSEIFSSTSPELYLSKRSDPSGKVIWTVIYQEQPLMADTEDKQRAILSLLHFQKQLGKKASDQMWDGDLGKFVKAALKPKSGTPEAAQFKYSDVEIKKLKTEVKGSMMKDEVGAFWFVTYPTDVSELADILGETSVLKLMLQFKGGLKEEHVAGLYKSKDRAESVATYLLGIRDRVLKNSKK